MARILAVLLCSGLFVLAACGGDKPKHEEQAHWGYEGGKGPAKWAELDPNWTPCGQGRRQSPIAIDGAESADVPEIVIHYTRDDLNVENNGHTIQFNCEPDNYITVAGEKFTLLQFHFHAPSEHVVKGEKFALEGHFVHKNEKGEIAVIGLLVRAGEHNKAFEPIWSHLPGKGKKEQGKEGSVQSRRLIPDKPTYYSYEGSLTTPPCTEGGARVPHDDAHRAGRGADQYVQHPLHREQPSPAALERTRRQAAVRGRHGITAHFATRLHAISVRSSFAHSST